MATMLTSIAWGWLLNNQSFKMHYIFIVSTVTLLNFVAQGIANMNEDTNSDKHLYEMFSGKIVLLIRIIVSLLFTSGCLYISFQCNEKVRPFIRSFA